MVAALYVQPSGTYYGLDGVEPWGLPDRDAREYTGPYPVVAHPPCARWGAYATGNPRWPGRYRVIEHPAYSKAWAHFGLFAPPAQGWVNADLLGGWTCHVEQGHYGHLARKATWLYVFGVATLPDLTWGPAQGKIRIDAGCRSTEEYRRRRRTGVVQLLSHRARAATPEPFRDLLLDIARSVRLP